MFKIHVGKSQRINESYLKMRTNDLIKKQANDRHGCVPTWYSSTVGVRDRRIIGACWLQA